MAKEWAKAFYNSQAWQDTRQAILKRDRYTCQRPGCYNPAEEVHHKTILTEENINDTSVSLNPENLISLCGECHKRMHKRERAGGHKKGNSVGDGILAEIEFDENGYPIPAGGRASPRG